MYMNICIWDPHVICALLCHYSEVRMYMNVCIWDPHVICALLCHYSGVRMYMNVCIWDPHVICALLCHYSGVRMYINVCVWGLHARMHAKTGNACVRTSMHRTKRDVFHAYVYASVCVLYVRVWLFMEEDIHFHICIRSSIFMGTSICTCTHRYIHKCTGMCSYRTATVAAIPRSIVDRWF